MATVELSVDANLAGLRSELGKIPGLTAEQAKLMTAELNKSIKASERAAKAAGAASKRAMEEARVASEAAAKSVGDVGDKFGHVGSAAGKLAGGLDLLAPGLGDVARGVADLADVGEVGASLQVFSVVAGSAAAAVGLLALSLAPIAELILEERREAEATKAALDAYTSATEAAQAANDKFATSLESVNDYIKLATGLETQAEQTARKRIDALRTEAQVQTAATQALIDSAEALKARKEEEQSSLIAAGLRRKLSEEEVAQLKANKGIIEDLNDGLADNRRRLEEVAQATESSTEFITLETQAIEHAARNSERKASADKARAKAADEARAAEMRNAEAIKALVDQIAAYDALDAEFQKSLEDAAALHEANAKAITDKHAAALDGFSSKLADLVPTQPLDELTKLELLLSDVSLAMSRAPTEELGMRYSAMADEITAQIERVKMAQSGWYAQATQISEGVNGVAQTGAALFESLGTISEHAMERASTAYAEAIADRKRLGKDATDAEKKAAKEEVEARRNALIKAFMVDKAVKMSQALINTALAVTSALTAGPIAGPILATAAGAAGAVQVAAIASEAPSFHRGGLIGQPDEMTATVRSGEAVLNPMGRSRLGDQTIRDLNAGASNDSGGQAIQVVYGHRAFDYFVKSHLRTRMTLPRALGKGTRTGQRGG
jgi:hypothetical protein